MSSTLIHGEHDAILVDTLVTFDQANVLADWVDGFGKKVIAILIAHGHSDHWIGLQRLLQRFPCAKALARQAPQQRAQFEATDPKTKKYWQSTFPGEIPDDPTVPAPLMEGGIDIEEQRLEFIDIGQGDTEHSTVIHVPSIAAVVAGDVVYNQVHMLTVETDERSRQAWMHSLDRIAALQPRIVVAGHKRVNAPDTPDNIGASKRYLADFTRIAAERKTVEGIVNAMLALHGDRDNPYVVWLSARRAVARRG